MSLVKVGTAMQADALASLDDRAFAAAVGFSRQEFALFPQWKQDHLLRLAPGVAFTVEEAPKPAPARDRAPAKPNARP